MTQNTAKPSDLNKTAEKTEIPVQKAEEIVTEVITDVTDGEVDNSKLGKLKAALKKHKTTVIWAGAAVVGVAYVILKNVNNTETKDADEASEDSSS
jgi:hypothetical protein